MLCKICKQEIKGEAFGVYGPVEFLDEDRTLPNFTIDFLENMEFVHRECLVRQENVICKGYQETQETISDVARQTIDENLFIKSIQSLGQSCSKAEAAEFLSKQQPKSIEDAISKWFKKM